MSRFELNVEIKELELEQPFTIARGTKRTVRNVFVQLSASGFTGFGEAAPNSRYDENAESVTDFIETLSEDFFEGISRAGDLSEKLLGISPPVKSAVAALEMAWLDWWGKSQGQPLWELWKAPSHRTPPTSYTIGLDDIEVMKRKVERASPYPILKVKLGTERDRQIIEALREVTDKPIRVDANEGWATLEQAKQQISFLAECDIELVEQPMPAGMRQEMKALKQWSPLPLMADESFMGEEDLEVIAGLFDGINIKLMKIGSLVKARQVIRQARKLDLDVMVGCMIESSLGNAAGALLGTWADFVDLDGHLLIKDDPFGGLDLSDRKEVVLSNSPGLAVWKRNGKSV